MNLRDASSGKILWQSDEDLSISDKIHEGDLQVASRHYDYLNCSLLVLGSKIAYFQSILLEKVDSL